MRRPIPKIAPMWSRALTLLALASMSACGGASDGGAVAASAPAAISASASSRPATATPASDMCALPAARGELPRAARAELDRLGYDIGGEWIGVEGVTVVSAVLKGTADGHFQNIFFFRDGTLLTSDRGAKGSGTHYTANICSAASGLVTTGYILNESGAGFHQPGCPAPVLAKVRWRVVNNSVDRLDALPREC